MMKKKRPKQLTAQTQSVTDLKGLVRKSKVPVSNEEMNTAVALRCKYSLEELLNEMPEGAPIDKDWENMRPMGKEM